MLDINYIRENKDLVQKAAENKNQKVELSELLKTDDKRRTLQQQIDALRTERNNITAAAKGKKPSATEIEKGKELREKVAKLEREQAAHESKLNQLLLDVPNVPTDNTPIGKDESGNKVIRLVGDQPEIKSPKAHWELAEAQGWLDFDRAGKVSGSRFTYIKGNLVKLQFALINFVLDVLTSEQQLSEIAKKAKLVVNSRAFIPVLTPDIIKEDVFKKLGRLEPIEDKYRFDKDHEVMAGSAEHALAPMHMDEILSEQDLPLRYVGYSTNFRREAGSYGKDVRGMLRQHQFDKLEMESFTTADDGLKEQDFLVAIQEHLMQALQLPYQVVAICTGDMGKPDARQIDIETWMPGQGSFRETQTSDYMTDYQARALNIRYKTKDGKTLFAHMNDATAIALGRTMISILENHQQPDGSVKLPKVLHSYYGGGGL